MSRLDRVWVWALDWSCNGQGVRIQAQDFFNRKPEDEVFSEIQTLSIFFPALLTFTAKRRSKDH